MQGTHSGRHGGLNLWVMPDLTKLRHVRVWDQSRDNALPHAVREAFFQILILTLPQGRSIRGNFPLPSPRRHRYPASVPITPVIPMLYGLSCSMASLAREV